MKRILRARWAVIPLAAAACLPAQPAAAEGQVAIARVTISMTADRRVVVAPPNSFESTPNGWSCARTDPSPVVYRVSCVPLAAGEWTCSETYVMASYEGSFADTIVGKATCGGTTVGCRPQQAGLLRNYCEEHTAGGTLPALECTSDITGSNVPQQNLAAWSVTCATYAP